MDRQAEELYGELRKMAGSFMRRERAGHTLQPTALANEAFLYLRSPSMRWDNTGHYFGAAARAMRNILIQYARARRARKRGGEAVRVPLDELQLPAPARPDRSYEINEVLQALADEDPALVRLVELRYVYGHTMEEISEMTGRSIASVKRDWQYTRARLLQSLSQ